MENVSWTVNKNQQRGSLLFLCNWIAKTYTKTFNKDLACIFLKKIVMDLT